MKIITLGVYLLIRKSASDATRFAREISGKLNSSPFKSRPVQSNMGGMYLLDEWADSIKIKLKNLTQYVKFFHLRSLGLVSS